MTTAELDRWHGRPVAEWAGEWYVPALRVFRRVGSTNDVAAAMAIAGAAQGALVIAEEQTEGRGRRGRGWTAPHGTSLSLSMVLRPPTPAASRILTLRLGIAAAAAIEEVVPVGIALKWPNDLMVDDRKLGGILCEATLADDRVDHVIAGIGVNLRRPEQGWPRELAGRAISLEEEATRPDTPPAARRAARKPAGLDPPALVARLAAGWLRVAGDPRDVLSEREIDGYASRDGLRGRQVTVDGRTAGVAEGISPMGALRVRGNDGVAEITAGTVRTTESLAGEHA